jgi:hypothetical protein
MRWEIIISAIIAVVGGVASHQLAAWRDRTNKRREYRVTYLIEVFRSLCEVSRRPPADVLDATDRIDGIVADIQFLGSDEQIEAARELVKEIIEKRSANLEALMIALQEELRKELGRSPSRERIVRLKASNKSGTDKPEQHHDQV